MSEEKEIKDIIEEQVSHLFADENEGNILSVQIGHKKFKSLFPPETHEIMEKVLSKLVFDGVLTRPFLNVMEHDVDNNDFYYKLTDIGENWIRKFYDKDDTENHFVKKIYQLIESIENSSFTESNKKNYLLTLDEIRKCYSIECFNATIALCGKIVEIYLREVLRHFNINVELYYDDRKTGSRTKTTDLTLGQLYNLTHTIKADEKLLYIEPRTIELIKSYRNGVIHFSEKIPIPSLEQTEAIVLFVIDIMKRRLSYNW